MHQCRGAPPPRPRTVRRFAPISRQMYWDAARQGADEGVSALLDAALSQSRYPGKGGIVAVVMEDLEIVA